MVFSLGLWFKDYLLRGYTFISEANQMNWVDWQIQRRLLYHLSDLGWNPDILFGVNYMGREGFMNPLNLGNFVGLLFKDAKTGLMAGTMLVLMAMGVSMYLFLRSLRISHPWALLGMAMYMLCPKWIGDAYHGPRGFIVGYALLPWAVRLLLRMGQHRFENVRDFVLLGAILALLYLSLGAVFTIMLCNFLAALFLYLLFLHVKQHNPSMKNVMGRVVACLTFSGFLLIALSSHVLLPFIQNYHYAVRSLYSPSNGYPIAKYAGLIFPWVNRIFGHGVYDLPYPAILPVLESNNDFYFGILVVPVVLYALVLRLGDEIIRFFLWAPILWLILWNRGVMKVFPLLNALDNVFKGTNSQYYGQVVLVFCFSVAVSSTLDQMGKNCELQKRENVKFIDRLIRGLALAYAAAAGVFVIGAWAANSPVRKLFWDRITNKYAILFYYYFHDAVLVFIGAFLARSLLLWLFQKRLIFRKWGVVAALLLSVTDFGLCFQTWYPFTNMDERYSASLPQNDFVIKQVLPLERVGAFHYQIAPVRQWRAFVDQKAPYEYRDLLREIDGLCYQGFLRPLYEPSFSYFPLTVPRSFYGFHEGLMPQYFWDFDRAMNGANPRYLRQSWTGLWDPHSPLLNIAGINYLFWYEPVHDSRWLEVARYRGYHGFSYVYRNKRALPRAYIVPRVEYYKDRPQLLERLSQKTFDPFTTATTEDAELPPQLNGASPGRTHPASVSIKRYTPNHVEMTARTAAPALLILNDMYFPNWNATVNGLGTKIFRVNAVFRGVRLPAGESRVEFNYRNPYFQRGAQISIVSWTLVLLYLLGGIFLKGALWKTSS